MTRLKTTIKQPITIRGSVFWSSNDIGQGTSNPHSFYQILVLVRTLCNRNQTPKTQQSRFFHIFLGRLTDLFSGETGGFAHLENHVRFRFGQGGKSIDCVGS